MPELSSPLYDVIIVGAGPAGLSAALVLGRCRRNVLVFDDDLPRNAAAREVRGFLTREGTSPEGLRRLALDQLAPYRVTLESARATSAVKQDGVFVIGALGQHWQARRLLLATGVRDRCLEIPGRDGRKARGRPARFRRAGRAGCALHSRGARAS
jgi:thioredoxin reductase